MAQRLLPDWFRAYGEYTAESDAAKVFHVWTALGIIAGAAQRKIFMRSKRFPVYSNMYLLYVADPGKGRKSTAIRIGKELLAEVEPKVNFAAESGSFEALADSMGKITNPSHQSMTLFSSELGTLMQTNTAAMVNYLTDIYDCPNNWTRRTMAHTVQTIARPWLNIIGGTTPDWLSANAGVIAIDSGLTARCIISYSDELSLENAWDEETELDKQLKNALVHDLSIIAMLEGEVKFRPDALEWYREWYRDRSRFPLISDPRTASYFIREHIHLLKVAMAFHLSYSNELFLELEDLHRARDLLVSTHPLMKKALNAVGKNEWAGQAAYLLHQIRKAKSISYRDLLIENAHNLNKRNLDMLLEELRISGRIRQEGSDWKAVNYQEEA